MKKFFFLTFIAVFLGLASYGQAKPKNIMLVLGSANSEILTNRVKVASKLYRVQKFDRIIVSGGCGAHVSTICEASAMKAQLVKKGIPYNIIYKEENSKTTVQNYIFSRILEDENGQQIIQKNDSLYIVSDHWHAIAVAARFKKYDGVYAKFFIEGDLVPKPTDLLDYGGIFNKEVDNNIFILKGLWPSPDAVFRSKGFTQYVFADRFYAVDLNRPNEARVAQLKQLNPALPSNWKSVDAVARDDKKGLSIMFNKLECQISFDQKNKTSKLLLLHELVSDLPTSVKGVDASFIKDKDLYVFTGSKVIIATKKGNSFKKSKIEDIKTFVNNWPYVWGPGDLTAADYDAENKIIYLYKNREVLTIDPKNNSAALPKRLPLKWQDNKN